MIITGWILICLSISILSRKIFPNQKELSRKIVHIGIGPIIPMAWWFGIPKLIAMTASSIITFALIINYQFRFIAEVEDVSRKSYGTIAYATSITILLFIFWPENASIVSAAVLSMAFGDGLAGLVGPQIKSKTWKVFNQTKSVAGTLTMMFVVMFILFAIPMISGLPINPLRVLTITSLAVVMEQISFWGVDNLTVPISIAITWGWMTN